MAKACRIRPSSGDQTKTSRSQAGTPGCKWLRQRGKSTGKIGMADASIRSKPKRYDHPHANADYYHADHYHDADGSDGALGARDHAAKAGPVWA